MKMKHAAGSILSLALICAGTACTNTAGRQSDGSTNATPPQSPSWKSDVIAFERRLAEIVSDTRTPTEEEIVGNGRRGFGREWAVITDGAGGVVDLNPEPGTVQHVANDAFKGQTVRWALTLADDEMPLLGTTALVPDLGFDVSKSFAESSPDEIPHLGMIMFATNSNRDSNVGSLEAGDRVIVEGTFGDASKNRGFLVTSFTGPVALYHLGDVEHPIFWVGLADVSITRAEVSRAE